MLRYGFDRDFDQRFGKFVDCFKGVLFLLSYLSLGLLGGWLIVFRWMWL